MSRRISDEEIANLCLELSWLVDGADTGDALDLLAREAEEGSRKEMLKEMVKQVDSGKPLSAALRESGAFPNYVSELMKVREKAKGSPAETLSELSRYYEGRVRLAQRVRSALLYPAVMLALMLVVIGVLLVKVLPIFDDVYASLGGRLTGVAAGLLALGQGLERAMPVLFGVLAVVAALVLLFAVAPAFRGAVTAFWQKHFGDRGVSRKMNNARLAQALAMSLSGDSVDEALEVCQGLMEGGAKSRFEDCRDRVRTGNRLGDALRDSGFLSSRHSQLLNSAIKKKDAMEKIARDLSDESDATLEAMVSRVEPALVLVCSVLVGLILLSVMLPLMHIMSAIG